MARAEMEQCKIDSGQDPVTVGVTIGQDPFSAETADLVVSMMDDAFGEDISVVVTPIEQGQLIGLALAGAYHVMGWRNFGGVDPSELWYWWSAYTASPVNPTVPELALNFGRFIDPEMETAMQGVDSIRILLFVKQALKKLADSSGKTFGTYGRPGRSGA